jgi:hypothetical protein
MFGDNQAVIMSSSIPHSSLNKWHNALPYQRVREMIATKILGYYWIDGKLNPADIVSKHWSYTQMWHLLKPLLFYYGDQRDLLENWNNSGTTCPFHPVRLELERSTPVEETQVLDHQNPADIDEDSIVLVIMIRTQFHHVILFVVTNAIT